MAFVVNLCVYLQRVFGELGAAVRDAYRVETARMGGVWSLLCIMAIASFGIPPVALVCCVTSYRRDLEARRREADRFTPR